MTEQPQQSLLKQVSASQKAVNADMQALSKKYGAEVFRYAGQRYFKHEREQTALRQEIAAREDELRRLQRKAQR